MYAESVLKTIEFASSKRCIPANTHGSVEDFHVEETETKKIKTGLKGSDCS